ncbi:MAG: UDP-2,3-diacylglucosamine diphosphatase [Aromatoleum sp.]|nr:UDP-2,3-diacylglucosamine diphosphatase [Aromatoleum sp.]
MPPTLFVSDLHLAPERPALLAAFSAFCAGPARAAAAVYVLGDLFDAWIGDDQLRDPVAATVAHDLRGVADAGIGVHLMHGNRDFLLGGRFAGAAGATLMPEQVVVDLFGTPTLLLHGDEMCTDDKSYQRYRARTRNPAWQRSYLALPYFARRAVARWLRRKSRDETARKPDSILDVTSAAVENAFRDSGVIRMIHGHTHRPARHHVMVDGRDCERRVLADWYDRGSYLEVDEAGARTHDVAAPA